MKVYIKELHGTNELNVCSIDMTLRSAVLACSMLKEKNIRKIPPVVVQMKEKDKSYRSGNISTCVNHSSLLLTFFPPL